MVVNIAEARVQAPVRMPVQVPAQVPVQVPAEVQVPGTVLPAVVAASAGVPGSGARLEERGPFAHGACCGCDWVGPGRRARDRARRDAARHQVVHHP